MRTLRLLARAALTGAAALPASVSVMCWLFVGLDHFGVVHINGGDILLVVLGSATGGMAVMATIYEVAPPLKDNRGRASPKKGKGK